MRISHWQSARWLQQCMIHFLGQTRRTHLAWTLWSQHLSLMKPQAELTGKCVRYAAIQWPETRMPRARADVSYFVDAPCYQRIPGSRVCQYLKFVRDQSRPLFYLPGPDENGLPSFQETGFPTECEWMQASSTSYDRYCAPMWIPQRVEAGCHGRIRQSQGQPHSEAMQTLQYLTLTMDAHQSILRFQGMPALCCRA